MTKRRRLSDYFLYKFLTFHSRWLGDRRFDGYSTEELLDETDRRLGAPVTRPSEEYTLHMQYPHCEARILHAPGECKYCDQHSDWQQLRVTWGIAFSGHEPTEEQPIADPADLAVMKGERGDYNQWHGNRAYYSDGVS